jgi:hypothetical protein
MLASVGDAMTVTRSCEGLMPLAEELGIVKRCIDAVAGAAMEKVAASGEQILRFSFCLSLESNNGFFNDMLHRVRKIVGNGIGFQGGSWNV